MFQQLDVASALASLSSSQEKFKSLPFTPTLTSLTEVGTVTKTGAIFTFGDLVMCTIELAPQAISTLAATLGTTYVNNLPFQIRYGSAGLAVDTTVIGSIGVCAAPKDTTRLYLPTIAATGDTIAFTLWYVRKQ